MEFTLLTIFRRNAVYSYIPRFASKRESYVVSHLTHFTCSTCQFLFSSSSNFGRQTPYFCRLRPSLVGMEHVWQWRVAQLSGRLCCRAAQPIIQAKLSCAAYVTTSPSQAALLMIIHYNTQCYDIVPPISSVLAVLRATTLLSSYSPHSPF